MQFQDAIAGRVSKCVEGTLAARGAAVSQRSTHFMQIHVQYVTCC